MTVVLGVLIVASLLTLLAAISAPIAWPLKSGLIVLSFAVDFLVWLSIAAGAGWPVRLPLPPDAQFVACVVREPSQVDGVKGEIDLWLVPPSHGALDPSSPGEPRAYAEPYDESLQQACQSAQKMQAGGQQVGLRVAKGKKSQHRHSPSGASRGGYHAYVLPVPTPPRKAR